MASSSFVHQEEKYFCNNYLVLKPKEAGFSDLFSILCSSDNFKNRNVFDVSEEVAEAFFSLRRRWLIFISLVFQKFFILFKGPMSSFGLFIEQLLNYPTANGGFFRLLFNFLTGRVVKPDRESAKYMSFLGHIDPRVDLNKKIKPNEEGYISGLAIMAAKLSYENEAFTRSIVHDRWQMQFLGFFNFWDDYDEQYATQAIMFQDKKVDPNLIVVAFRGTSPFSADDWATDLNLSWYEINQVGRIHAGFMKALGLQRTKGWPKEIPNANINGSKQYAYYSIKQALKNALKENKKAKFFVTGHSLGGALAILFPAILFLHEEKELLDKMEGVYTFGQPRVGDEKFGEFMKKKLKEYDVKYYRYVYNNDIVPRLPYDDKTLMYKHFGPCLYFNSCYKGQILEEEPNRNYFSLLWVLPKILSAVFEVIRSLFLPLIRGWEYRESMLMKVSRLIGLLLPGLVDHAPTDYVNLTRLGTLPHLKND